jgi:ketosteroid isomerase-like protein
MFLCVCSLASIAQVQSEQSEVLAAVKTYDTAWNAKNVEAARAVMDENYVYFDSLGGVPRPRSSTLEFLARPDYKLTFVERSELQAFVTKDIAVVSSRWKGKGSWSGGPIDDDQRCGLVFAKQEKVWKLLSEHCIQIVPN